MFCLWGPSWGFSWSPLGASSGLLGAILTYLGAVFGRLGPILETAGPVLSRLGGGISLLVLLTRGWVEARRPETRHSVVTARAGLERGAAQRGSSASGSSGASDDGRSRTRNRVFAEMSAKQRLSHD